MPYSPILIGPICAGTLRLLSGTAALSFRKGFPRHILAGNELSKRDPISRQFSGS